MVNVTYQSNVKSITLIYFFFSLLYLLSHLQMSDHETSHLFSCHEQFKSYIFQ